MSSVSGIRLPGLATGMDTEAMIKEMLTGEQNKVDKAKQKEQTIKWQQEIYRDVIKDIQGLNDKYFSITSKNSVTNASAWNTMAVSSSNSSVITATGSAGANPVNYKFEVNKLATAGKASSTTALNGVKIKKESTLKDLGITDGVTEFHIRYGDKENEVSSKITLRTEPLYKYEQKTDVDGKLVVDAEGNPVYDMTKPIYKKDANGNIINDTSGNPIQVVDEPADTVATLISKINEASGGKIKASYSEMTGEFTIEGIDTGAKNGFTIVGTDKTTASNALDFFNLSGKDATTGKFEGTDLDIKVYGSDGNPITSKAIDDSKSSNSFTIDGVTYNIHGTGTSEMTSKTDTQPVIDNMKAFVEDYNKLMDKMYDLVTEKKNKEYSPLTEAQKKDMSEEEIERWEKKSKEGLLRNDSEMRKFMDDMQGAIFGDKIQILSEMGITSHQDYNKKGQIALDEEKFRKALETNSDKVYEVFAKDSSSVMENMKSTVKKYTGGSSSIFAQKAGIEKTASVAKNFYSEQLKRQAETIKLLQRKMDNKEDSLYKKFAALESSMNKLNSQMNHFAQM
ncbi:flagellar filament capping protein FliD [Romboutsia lituseburensis]|uniref:flagellar filament capping protein FliD n=1 Tax=Romboutsia lituseburensis TaxID=1537 RepID=UPI0022EA3C89|nr:flagellar filament capping protein FliD [Romboutsia lituseburensis]